MTYRRKSPEDFVDELKPLLATNAAGNLQLASRLNQLVKEGALAIRAPRGASPDSSELLSRLLDFQLAAYSVVSTHTLAILDGLISSAEQTILDRAQPEADGGQQSSGARGRTVLVPRSAEPPASMRLEGRLGETLSCPFLVENQYNRALDVSFEADPLVPSAGPTLPASLVSFEPATLALSPRGQAVAQAKIELIDEFAVGQTYSTALQVLGFQAPPVRLAITVLAAAKPADARGTRNRSKQAQQPEPTRRARPSRARGTTSASTS